MTDALSSECVRIQAALSEYLDGELPPDLRQEVQAHLGGCAICRVYCETLRETVALCRQSPRPPVDRECLRRAARAAREELARRGLL